MSGGPEKAHNSAKLTLNLKAVLYLVNIIYAKCYLRNNATKMSKIQVKPRNRKTNINNNNSGNFVSRII